MQTAYIIVIQDVLLALSLAACGFTSLISGMYLLRRRSPEPTITALALGFGVGLLTYFGLTALYDVPAPSVHIVRPAQ